MTAEGRIAATADRYGEPGELAEAAIRRAAWRRSRGGKTCAHCHQHKPLAAFGKDSRERDGLHRLCRVCVSERDRALSS